MINQSITTLLIDDEKPARETLASYINEYCPILEIVATCETSASAFKAIQAHQPKLLFLDIEMPGENGFELLRKIKRIDFDVIFTTAYSGYATRAFRVSAVDYLLKPIKISELIEAVTKVETKLKNNNFDHLATLIEQTNHQSGQPEKLIIPHQKGFTALNFSEIIMCKADGYCTHFYLSNKRVITSSHHLKYYEETLPNDKFMRVHHSYIINIEHIESYHSQGEIVMKDDLTCYLSHSHKNSFMKLFKKIK
jgi:two-component system, LytTR family, response regulator